MSTGMHEHRFDPISGWCGCGYRDDGRLTSKAGDIYRPGPEYTPEQLDAFLHRKATP